MIKVIILIVFIDLIMLLVIIQYCSGLFFELVNEYVTHFNRFTPHFTHYHTCESYVTRFMVNVVLQFNPF